MLGSVTDSDRAQPLFLLPHSFVLRMSPTTFKAPSLTQKIRIGARAEARIDDGGKVSREIVGVGPDRRIFASLGASAAKEHFDCR
jgi:hypothetical protein